MKTQIRNIFFWLLLMISHQLMAQTTIHVHTTNEGQECQSFYGIAIDSITYTSDERQLIWTSDSVYSSLLSEVDSITLGPRAELAVIEGDLGRFSQIRVAGSGEMGLIIENAETGIPSEILLFKPDEDMHTGCYSIIYNEEGWPEILCINETQVFVQYLDNSMVSFTVVTDSVVFSVDSLALEMPSSGDGKRRAWADNNWARNTSAVLQVASGLAGVVIGSVSTLAGIVAEAPSIGASTVVTMGGVATVAGGVMSINEGLQKLYGAPETYMNQNNTLGRDILLEDGSLLFSSDALHNPTISMGDYLRSGLNKAGIVNFIIGLGANILDFWGETTTENQRVAQQHRAYNVLTGLNKDVTRNSAVLRGYVTPEATRPVNSVKVQNEYGIVVRSASGYFQCYKTINGDGGMIEEKATNLFPNTTYTYYTYFIDKTHGITRIGESKTFTTLNAEPPVITEFKVTKKEYKQAGFSNKGKSYDYCFNASTSVKLEADKDVVDWGYVYEDPDGEPSLISLRSYGTSYTDTRYAYYRNEKESTARLYGYVKYDGDDKYYYGESHDYDLIYEDEMCPDDHHPHAIDLGLPSGTKWACCNVGASSPEGYGSYYAWGETQTKSDYRPGTYKYAQVSNRGYWDDTAQQYYTYVNIGTDIAGTSYDAATANWGAPWCMPSLAQIQELINNCSSRWTQQNGVNGRLFTGKNGNSVFLPAAGFRWNGSLNGEGSGGEGLGGDYWSSSLSGSYPNNGCCLYFSSGSAYCSSAYRDIGFTVRPVRKN